jgi:PTS system, IID component
MTASYVRLESGLQLVRHVEGVEKPFVYSLQKDLIDPIMPKLLPLLWTLFILWRIKKGTSTLKLVVWTIIFGLVCIGLPVLVKHWFGVDIIDPAVLAERMSQG